jgi:hypothetical protein
MDGACLGVHERHGSRIKVLQVAYNFELMPGESVRER